jgi:AraC-like DNA-binding protein
MYDQIREDTLFIMLYAVVTATAMMASCYLLFRRGNAFAPDITTPVRLRRWAAAFVASIALNHIWYMPIFFLSSSEDARMCDLVGGLLDSITIIPLAIVILFTMLQDRRRPLWPVAVMVAPLVVGNVFSIATLRYTFLSVLYVYFLLMCTGFILYMVHALKQYGRWLRDNYADLEHKEVWQSFVVLAIILLVLGIYVFTSDGPVYQYAMQIILFVLTCYLLWRVETLSDLSMPVSDAEAPGDRFMAESLDQPTSPFDPLSVRNRSVSPLGLSKNIEPLLKKYCEEPQLYLQYDISLSQLAKQVGINRTYLSKHFALQGITYNAYINRLRIQHFINLYHEVAATHQPVTAQQLAHQSGFRSYNTFSVAFKKIMGMNTTEWMRNVAE